MDKVKERLEILKRSVKEETKKPTISAAEEYEQRLSLQVAEEELLKRQKREEAAARKKEREAGSVIYCFTAYDGVTLFL